MKAGVIGVGKLGGAIAFALALDGRWDEIVLSDVVERLAWAQAEDVRHGLCHKSRTSVCAGSIEDMDGADVVVLVAGKPRSPGMTRLDLLEANVPVAATLSREIARVAPNAAIVVLTNPLDVITAVVQKASGFPRLRVLGSGALVDSVRFRCILADRLRVPPSEVEATVLGEHGEHAILLFDQVRVRGKPATFTDEQKQGIAKELLGLSAKVIQEKGATAFGPSGCTAALVHALFDEKPSVVPASIVLDGEYGLRGVALGVPALMGGGKVQKIEEWPLSAKDRADFRKAGQDLGDIVKKALATADAT